MATVNRDMLVLRPSDPQEEYRRRTLEKKTTIHWGQYKLLYNEIAFFNYFYNPVKHPNSVVIYAGAASGIHIRVLIQMFPQILRWYLYDPRDFDLFLEDEIKDKVEIHTKTFDQATNRIDDSTGYFTDEVARGFAELKRQGYNLWFISDIRTADFKKMSNKEVELAVIKDNMDQMRWVQIMQPVKAHLKFRAPYPDVYDKKYFEYYDGLILRQPWAAQSSTETRLILDASASKIWYDVKLYQDQMFYFNVQVRENRKFKVPGLELYGGELQEDFDSAITLQIIEDYLVKQQYPVTPENIKIYYDFILQQMNINRQHPLTVALKRQYLNTTDLMLKRMYVDDEDEG